MKNIFAVLGLVAVMGVVGCSNSSNGAASLVAPTAVAPGVLGSGVSRVKDVDFPTPLSWVEFKGLSNVLVTNNSGQDQEFTFVVFKATDLTDITGASSVIMGIPAHAKLVPGQIAELSTAFAEECGAFYHHAVYESGEVGQGRVYAPGGPYIQSTIPACQPADKLPIEGSGTETICHVRVVNGRYAQETLTLDIDVAESYLRANGNDHAGACDREIPPVSSEE